eukprot:1023189-Rhodomonas_salina.1
MALRSSQAHEAAHAVLLAEARRGVGGRGRKRREALAAFWVPAGMRKRDQMCEKGGIGGGGATE